MTQTHRIKYACGDPCEVDEVLHADRLADDWLELLTRYPGLPQVALPTINRDEGSYADHPWGEPPQVVYTPELRALVRQMDEWVFHSFNYTF